MRMRFWFSFFFSAVLASSAFFLAYVEGRWGSKYGVIEIVFIVLAVIVLMLIWINELDRIKLPFVDQSEKEVKE